MPTAKILFIHLPTYPLLNSNYFLKVKKSIYTSNVQKPSKVGGWI